MPIYEYACHDCGQEFEKIQSFSDSSTPACPNCQGMHVRRRISQPAIHFKGSGWYITDSKNASKSSANGGKKDEGGDAKEAAPSTAPSDDAKPATSEKTSAEKKSD